MRKGILIFIAGAICGAIGTALYYENYFNKLPILEEDIEPTDHGFEPGDIINLYNGNGDVVKTVTSVTNGIEHKKKILMMNQYKGEKVDYSAISKKNCPPDVEPVDPYVISIEEFTDSEREYDKITLTFYSGENILVDESEEVVQDILDTVGPDALKNFGSESEDPDIVYVRNERLKIDYEVIRLFENFDDMRSRGNKET